MAYARVVWRRTTTFGKVTHVGGLFLRGHGVSRAPDHQGRAPRPQNVCDLRPQGLAYICYGNTNTYEKKHVTKVTDGPSLLFDQDWKRFFSVVHTAPNNTWYNDYVMRPRSYSRGLHNTEIYVNVNVSSNHHVCDPYLRPYGIAYICYGNTCEKKHVTKSQTTHRKGLGLSVPKLLWPSWCAHSVWETDSIKFCTVIKLDVRKSLQDRPCPCPGRNFSWHEWWRRSVCGG